jgi:hypothetical protein
MEELQEPWTHGSKSRARESKKRRWTTSSLTSETELNGNVQTLAYIDDFTIVLVKFWECFRFFFEFLIFCRVVWNDLAEIKQIGNESHQFVITWNSKNKSHSF